MSSLPWEKMSSQYYTQSTTTFNPEYQHTFALEDSEYLAAVFYGTYLLLLLISFLSSYCLAQKCPKCVWLSEAGLSLAIGFIGGGLLELLVFEDKIDRFSEKEVRDNIVQFSTTFLFCVLLPPIIFDSGFRLRGPFFWANIDKITLLAFAGTFISSIVIAVLLWLGRYILAVPYDEDHAFEFSEALTFGALISATDPVTTLAIFEQLHVDPHLFNVVFGESVLNDAVSIVLFHTFVGLQKSEEKGHTLHRLVTQAVFNFLYIFAGSSLVGVLMGCLSSLLFKHVNLRSFTEVHGPKTELAVFLIFCYVPFLLAECAGLSGIVAILFTGVSMKRYTYNNLSDSAKEGVSILIPLVSHVAESMIFIDLGTSAWKTFKASVPLVFWAAFACLVARAAHVYPIGWALNASEPRYPRRRFDKQDMHMVWFSGLRGAIAYALSTQFPGDNKRCVMSITMWIVLASVWVMGGATVPVLKLLGIRRMEGDSLRQLSLTLEPAVNRLRIVHWDRQHLQPFLVYRGAHLSSVQDEDQQGLELQAVEGGSVRDSIRIGLHSATRTSPEKEAPKANGSSPAEKEDATSEAHSSLLNASQADGSEEEDAKIGDEAE
eukprot:TRINITY_DN35940_c0_g1_i1.p1 TRINITY_DN35940_c0_g1~~TRINITY_DN35940_c0_g1_i1.p1  ORF type:complete len:603 (+),score=50.27 TRINITY_DN35940_c0_g1_i1:27-1835(+)